MAELKNKPTGENIDQFLNGITDVSKRQDCFTLLELIRQITRVEPKLWASSMVGFGDYHYRYASGREGDTFILGFAPRKQNIVLYGMAEIAQCKQAMEKLGKYKAGVGCIYIKRLEDIDLASLSDMIKQSYEHKRKLQT